MLSELACPLTGLLPECTWQNVGKGQLEIRMTTCVKVNNFLYFK